MSKLLAAFLTLAAFAFADSSTASLAGILTDPSQAVVPNVAVTIKDQSTAVTRTAQTNSAGYFEFIGLSASTYEIVVQQPNFNKLMRVVTLRVGDQVRADLELSISGADQITVLEGARSETPATSTVINGRAIQELPSNGRQLQNLAQLAPGVSGGWNQSSASNRYGKARENTEGAFTVNGARPRANNFNLDGNPLNLRQYSVINFEPSNEAVQEFEVKTSVPPAEFGRSSGGTVNIVTRSGGNAFHGTLYEFFRNDKLDANSTFSNSAGLPRGEVRQNQFGGSIGGPIIKNKHFFFANTEFLRNIESSETRVTGVPTAAERGGLLRYTDAAGASRTLDLSSRVTPLSRKLLDLYPAPNFADPSGTGLNYNTNLPIALNDYQYHVRTDHYLTSRDTAGVRVSWNLNDQVYVINRFGGPYIPGFSLPNPEETVNGTGHWSHTFTPRVINEARFGVNRYTNNLANGDQRNAATFGLPNGSNANGIPAISFNAGSLEMLGGQPWFNREQNEATIHFADSVNWIIGRHTIAFGGDISRFQFNTRGAYNQRGSLTFDGSLNTLLPKTAANQRANALADFLLGLPNSASITTGNFGRGYRQWLYSLYVQDDWRLSRRLTLTYGLRYEDSEPWTEVNNRLSNFVPGRGLAIGPLYQPDRNNFSPRVGFTYDLTGKGSTILRSGFAILYDTITQAYTVQQIENNAPYSANAITFAPTPFAASGDTNATLLNLRNAATPSNSLGAVNRSLRNPYSLQYTLNIQHSFGDGWFAEAGFHYTRGVRLPVNYNLNQVPVQSLSGAQRNQILAAGANTSPIINALRPFPAFDSINYFDSAATSTYAALQLKLERRFRNGLNFLAGYTWGKSIDNASDFDSGDASERVLNSYNLANQRGPSSFDIKHRFVGSFNYELPYRGATLKPVLAGWQLNGIITLQTGQPFTPYTSSFDPFRNESFNRLDVVGDPNKNVPAGFAYNPAAFREPALGTFGNSGRNIVRGDGFQSVDLSIFKNIRITEALKLQMRFEAINALNLTNYQGPNVNQASSPGRFVSAAPPRQVQLGARLTF